jgi:hypothetical protein
MPLVILHHLLNVSVQLANKRGVKQNKNKISVVVTYKNIVWQCENVHCVWNMDCKATVTAE